MRFSWLPLVLLSAVACSNDKPKPGPGATSASVTPSSSTAQQGGGKGKGKGGGKGKQRAGEDFEKLTKPRKLDEWPKPGRYEKTLEHDGTERRYIVQIPPTHRPEEKAPVLFMLHDSGDKPEQYGREGLGISQMAARKGWIAVFPQGSEKHDKGYRWSHGLCFPDDRKKTDEVGFFRALIEQLKKDVKVDDRRLYAMGFGSGGHMTQVLGSALGDTLAGIAVIGGMSICQREGGEEERIPEPKEPISAIMLFGAKDPALNIEGGKTEGGLTTGSVKDMTAIWTKVDKCGDPNERGKETDAAITIDHKCDETGKRVLTVILNRTGHSIPEKVGNKPTMELIGRFLEGSFRKRAEK
jgi:polyhydroxybutyrate depolymerase